MYEVSRYNIHTNYQSTLDEKDLNHRIQNTNIPYTSLSKGDRHKGATTMTSNSTAMSTEEYQAQMALLKKGCHAYISSINPNYGYVPSLAGGIVFCVLFGACFFYHFFQSCRIRAATSILLALGALSMNLFFFFYPLPSSHFSLSLSLLSF